MKKYAPYVGTIFEKTKLSAHLPRRCAPRDRAALGLKSDSALFDETNKENMERWKNQTKEERLEEAWENRNKFEIRPDQGGLPRLNVPMNTMFFLTVILIVVVFLAKYLG